MRTVATRLAGSSDLYADDGRSPYASVNFITAHDGFTLRDLVSYNDKHNEANGEDNRDGTDNNRSWNCGVEGETDDAEIIAVRRRQAANLMATLCFSSGVPMLTAGDERGRTQGGNNNAYGQDNETSWIDWRPDDAWLDVYEITKTALRLRREHPALRQRHWFEGRPTIKGGIKDLVWVHPSGREMSTEDWNDDGCRTVGMFLNGAPLRSPGPRGEQVRDTSFMIWLNAGGDDVELTLPDNKWVHHGEVVLSTNAEVALGTRGRRREHAGAAGPLGAGAAPDVTAMDFHPSAWKFIGAERGTAGHGLNFHPSAWKFIGARDRGQAEAALAAEMTSVRLSRSDISVVDVHAEALDHRARDLERARAQLTPVRREPDGEAALVGGVAVAAHQPGGLEPLEQPRERGHVELEHAGRAR